LNNLIKAQNATLLCTHGYKSTIMGWLAARLNKIPVLAFSRGYTAENRKVAFYEWIERRILKKTNGIVCVSNGQKQKLQKFGIIRPHCWVVHNAINTN
ncbi:hypothetical protein C6A37_12210, partial [Desulfobacteraceae bacterium SEEP-SAG9]